MALSVLLSAASFNAAKSLLDIVPDQESLTIEAQIAVEDISDIRPDMRAEIHLSAYKQCIVPIIHGDIIQISVAALSTPRPTILIT